VSPAISPRRCSVIISNRMITPNVPQATSRPIQIFEPLFLPGSGLALLPSEALFVVKQGFKAVHKKLMYLM
jgi:hypothetical protein